MSDLLDLAVLWIFVYGFGEKLGFFTLDDCRKGDYYRYLAEFKSGSEKKEAAEQSLKAYEVYFLTPSFSKIILDLVVAH